MLRLSDATGKVGALDASLFSNVRARAGTQVVGQRVVVILGYGEESVLRLCS